MSLNANSPDTRKALEYAIRVLRQLVIDSESATQEAATETRNVISTLEAIRDQTLGTDMHDADRDNIRFEPSDCPDGQLTTLMDTIIFG